MLTRSVSVVDESAGGGAVKSPTPMTQMNGFTRMFLGENQKQFCVHPFICFIRVEGWSLKSING
jgi:hypothetical protein